MEPGYYPGCPERPSDRRLGLQMRPGERLPRALILFGHGQQWTCRVERLPRASQAGACRRYFCQAAASLAVIGLMSSPSAYLDSAPPLPVRKKKPERFL